MKMGSRKSHDAAAELDHAIDVPSVHGTGSLRRSVSTRLARVTSRYGTIIALISLIVIFTVLKGSLFFTKANFVNIASDVAIGIVISCGLTIPMVANEFDLSIGYCASFAGVLVTGLVVKNGMPLVWAIVVTLAMSAVVGLINGLVMTRFNVVSFVATLGIGTILIGLDYGYSNGVTFSVGLPQVFMEINTKQIVGIPLPVYIAVVIALALWVTVNRSVFGYYLQAIGQNPDAAHLAGVRVNRVRVAAMVVSSVCAGIGGILLASELGGGEVSIADGYLLSAFAACFLGSVCLRDGEFHIVGTCIGVVTVGVAFNGLAIMGYATFWQYAVQGALLIGAVGVSTVGRKILASR